MTGQGVGLPSAGSPQKSERWGHTTATGSRIEIDDTPGAESINLQHHSGATVTIDPDGAVHIVSTGRKGIGIAAPFGDAFVSASGEVAIKGSNISLQCSGDLNMDIGGTLNIKSAAIKTTTNTLDETIDGSAARTVTNDQSTIIGGIKRDTVAGDSREQVSGTKITDVGKNLQTKVTGDSTHDTTGATTNTTKGAMKNISGGAQTLSAKGAMTLVSDGTAKISSHGELNLTASGALKIDGSEVNVSPMVDRANYAVQAAKAAILAGVVEPTEVQGSAASTSDVAAKEAEVMEANDIVDELTSVRKFPNYPNNAKLESASGGSVSTIEYDSTPSAKEVYDEYSSKNTGTLNPVTEETGYGTIPEGNRKLDIKSVTPPVGIPSQHDAGAKISRYFSLGDLINAKHSHPIPPSSYQQVVQNHIFVAYNVLDAIKAKYPDIEVTSAYRSNSKNHITGLAIDIVCSTRNMEVHADIARFARDNLPVDQVFIEKNTSGRSHVHVRATHGSGAPKVLTCGDPQCSTSTPGIDISYLKRKGTA
jgi:hypothetical protein